MSHSHARSPSWSRKNTENPPRINDVTKAAMGATRSAAAAAIAPRIVSITTPTRADTAAGNPASFSHDSAAAPPARIASTVSAT